MPTTLPTVSDFRDRFPEFANAAEEDINVLFEAATLWVDDQIWSPLDYKYAVLYLAAHYLRMSQIAQAVTPTSEQNTSSSSGSTSPIQTYLSSISIGGRTVSWRAPKTDGGATSNDVTLAGDEFLRQTVYGQLYIQLRRRNVIPVVVV